MRAAVFILNASVFFWAPVLYSATCFEKENIFLRQFIKFG